MWIRGGVNSSIRDVVYYKIGTRDFSFVLTHNHGEPWEVRGSHFGGMPGDIFPVVGYTVSHRSRRKALKAARTIARTLISVHTSKVG